jgi:hypothetical protein
MPPTDFRSGGSGRNKRACGATRKGQNPLKAAVSTARLLYAAHSVQKHEAVPIQHPSLRRRSRHISHRIGLHGAAHSESKTYRTVQCPALTWKSHRRPAPTMTSFRRFCDGPHDRPSLSGDAASPREIPTWSGFSVAPSGFEPGLRGSNGRRPHLALLRCISSRRYYWILRIKGHS